MEENESKNASFVNDFGDTPDSKGRSVAFTHSGS
jgi:hypothetical protein